MLQQTPVARVLPVWTEWLERWPDAGRAGRRLARATAIRHWGRLGYPRRALRLHAGGDRDRRAARRRRCPSSYADLLALPGIGAYTAAAVASFAFGRRHAVVDTNVRRVQARAVTGVGAARAGADRRRARLAEALLPPGDAAVARWNVAVMELGALVCTARAPRCGDCPLRDRCAWRAAGRPPYDGPAASGAGLARHRPPGARPAAGGAARQRPAAGAARAGGGLSRRGAARPGPAGPVPGRPGRRRPGRAAPARSRPAARPSDSAGPSTRPGQQVAGRYRLPA